MTTKNIQIRNKILKEYKNVIYLDLERPSDLQKLTDAEWFFSFDGLKKLNWLTIQNIIKFSF